MSLFNAFLPFRSVYSRCSGERCLAVLVAILCMARLALGADAPAISIEVDAGELPRRLIHTTLDIPCQPGPLRLWYPKWIPGTHGPKGRVEDIGGLRVEAADGTAIPWKRDEIELYCFVVQIPKGVTSVRVRLDTICESSSVEAAGIYSYGNASIGVINWNTCIVYPEGVPIESQQVNVRLKLPAGWKFATALKSGDVVDGAIPFKTVSLSTFIDSPLIAGRHLRTFPLKSSVRPVFLHLTSESPEALNLDPKVIELYSRVVREAEVLFGVTHYPEYHFLVVCSDSFGRFGVEHLCSSMNGVGERSLVDDNLRKGWVAMLLPHEFAHSWCGKYRRPGEMIATDYHSPIKTKLLWVYEGLTTYLGEVLMVRSGLVTPEEYRVSLTRTIRNLSNTAGRQWRPLEDTAVASHLSRNPGKSWNQLRRTQDYYAEGMLIWYECDAIIRERTDGAKSLDDFCKRFFAHVKGLDTVAGHDYQDVIRDLKATADYDWDTFLQRRVTMAQESLSLEVIDRLGYRLRYTDKPPTSPPPPPGSGPEPDNTAADSLGISIVNGQITTVIPGLPGDKSGLAPGMKVIGVNSRKFSTNRLRDAIADSIARKDVEFLLEDGEEFRTIKIPYADGIRYLELVRVDGKPDLLGEIVKARTK
ncbi:MAG: M61 family metallopeptidase [Planctomycetes bacterium]|nr:M61 family metallopeptidase [Planctomycetota bacterium]